MNPSMRLRPVHELAVSREEAAGGELRDCRNELDRQTAQLRQLEAYRDEYYLRYGTGQTLSSVRLREYHGFLRRLEQAIERQQVVIDKLQRRCGEKERDWKMAHTRTQALDKVIDRHRDREDRLADRNEQRLIDELALRGFGRH